MQTGELQSPGGRETQKLLAGCLAALVSGLLFSLEREGVEFGLWSTRLRSSVLLVCAVAIVYAMSHSSYRRLVGRQFRAVPVRAAKWLRIGLTGLSVVMVGWTLVLFVRDIVHPGVVSYWSHFVRLVAFGATTVTSFAIQSTWMDGKPGEVLDLGEEQKLPFPKPLQCYDLRDNRWLSRDELREQRKLITDEGAQFLLKGPLDAWEIHEPKTLDAADPVDANEGAVELKPDTYGAFWVEEWAVLEARPAMAPRPAVTSGLQQQKGPAAAWTRPQVNDGVYLKCKGTLVRLLRQRDVTPNKPYVVLSSTDMAYLNLGGQYVAVEFDDEIRVVGETPFLKFKRSQCVLIANDTVLLDGQSPEVNIGKTETDLSAGSGSYHQLINCFSQPQLRIGWKLRLASSNRERTSSDSPSEENPSCPTVLPPIDGAIVNHLIQDTKSAEIVIMIRNEIDKEAKKLQPVLAMPDDVATMLAERDSIAFALPKKRGHVDDEVHAVLFWSQVKESLEELQKHVSTHVRICQNTIRAHFEGCVCKLAADSIFDIDLAVLEIRCDLADDYLARLEAKLAETNEKLKDLPQIPVGKAERAMDDLIKAVTGGGRLPSRMVAPIIEAAVDAMQQLRTAENRAALASNQPADGTSAGPSADDGPEVRAGEGATAEAHTSDRARRSFWISIGANAFVAPDGKEVAIAAHDEYLRAYEKTKGPLEIDQYAEWLQNTYGIQLRRNGK